LYLGKIESDPRTNHLPFKPGGWVPGFRVVQLRFSDLLEDFGDYDETLVYDELQRIRIKLKFQQTWY